MILVAILILGFASLLCGRLLFGRWFNHVSLYSAMWTITLSLFQAGWIYYYPLESETWIIIIDGWCSFLIGSVIVIAARFARQGNRPTPAVFAATESNAGLDPVMPFVYRILWIVNGLALIAVLQHWYLLLQQFGSIKNVIIYGNILYSMRVREGLPGGIPYFDALALSGALISGICTAKLGKLKPVTVAPILITALQAIAGMGRAELLIAAILFASGYFLYRGRANSQNRLRERMRRAFMFAAAIIILVATAELVRSNRGSIENISSSTTALQKLRGGYLITPSIYMYLTIHQGVFNQYLKQGTEHTFWGANTFAPIYRIMSKFGFDTYVDEYLPFYQTPAGSNTGTYLRELHADFGYPGIILGPFLLGLVCSWLWMRNQDQNSFLNIAVLGHFYVVVLLSFFIQATRLGYWLVSILGCVVACYFIERRSRAIPNEFPRLP